MVTPTVPTLSSRFGPSARVRTSDHRYARARRALSQSDAHPEEAIGDGFPLRKLACLSFSVVARAPEQYDVGLDSRHHEQREQVYINRIEGPRALPAARLQVAVTAIMATSRRATSEPSLTQAFATAASFCESTCRPHWQSRAEGTGEVLEAGASLVAYQLAAGGERESVQRKG